MHPVPESADENVEEPMAPDVLDEAGTDVTEDGARAAEPAQPQAQLDELRLPAVILAAGACAVSAIVFGITERGIVAAVVSCVLIVLAAIDLEHRILPNRIVGPAIVVVLALQLAFFPDRALDWLLAGPAAALFLAAPLIFRRDAMGMGDIKLAVLLGAAVGWDVFGAIVIGCLAMVPIALWMLKSDGTIRNATLPFGPFLAFGTLVVLFTS